MPHTTAAHTVSNPKENQHYIRKREKTKPCDSTKRLEYKPL